MINKEKKELLQGWANDSVRKVLALLEKEPEFKSQSSHKNQLGMVTCNTKHGELGGSDRQIPGSHGPPSLAYVQNSRQTRDLVSYETGKVP